MKEKILIIDDEQRIRMVLHRLLESQGYQVEMAEDGESGLMKTEKYAPDLILLDLKMPKKDGLETLRDLEEKGFPGKVIILTAFGTINSAVEAMRIGAFEYITKPYDADELLLIVDRALQQRRIENKLLEARSRLEEKFSISGIITSNPEMKRLLETVIRIAPTDVPVLICGASGTGKELFANAIHQHSRRKDRSFIALNCSALPENLVESELFGYREGAFSGARHTKRGLVEEADKGTLFLDEVSEMGPELQAKLLRFTQSGEFIPLGGTKSRKVDVRIIAASNRDIKQAISDGEFRQDLYYRLNVVMFEIPPLQDRAEDILLLVDHFLKKHGRDLGKEDYYFRLEALDSLQLYEWPGNVRELENAVNSALVMTSDNPISLDALPVTVKCFPTVEVKKVSETSLHDVVSSYKEAVEKRAIAGALEVCRGNQTKAAEYLGIGRRTLLRKMKQYRIK